MKKTISLIILLTLLISSTFLQTNAMKDTNIQETTTKGMMNSDMMKKMNTIMKQISDSLDEKGKIQLKDMRKNHMSDMKAFKSKFKLAKKDVKMKAMKEMKKRHFADLKEILKNNVELYAEVTTKMKNMMKNMMKKKMALKNNGSMMTGKDHGLKMENKKMHEGGMMNSDMMKKVHTGKMNNIKKRLLSSRSKNNIDKVINRMFFKLNKLDSEIKNKKIQSILSRLNKAKSNIKNLKNQIKKNKINNIIDYLKEQISQKAGLSMMDIK